MKLGSWNLPWKQSLFEKAKKEYHKNAISKNLPTIMDLDLDLEIKPRNFILKNPDGQTIYRKLENSGFLFPKKSMEQQTTVYADEQEPRIKPRICSINEIDFI